MLGDNLIANTLIANTSKEGGAEWPKREPSYKDKNFVVEVTCRQLQGQILCAEIPIKVKINSL